ncbi:DUF2892 domain-containing protein [Crocinitomicaceae bacterium]|nr:DUF2892 domain-containing protein [Crocinitomicaceae bacterium]MDB3906232.1 DUF2892 domain-containing protein [Crocinitomicaceae bacterium]
MKVNLGLADRVIRLLIAVAAVILFYAGVTSGILGITLIVVGAILALTSLISFCPIYAVFGIKTCPADTKA